MSVDLLLDSSAWTRLGHAALEQTRVDEIADAIERRQHHRLRPVDLILAAVADRHGIGILHYDGGFDVLTAKTDLRFESVWLAPRGSL